MGTTGVPPPLPALARLSDERGIVASYLVRLLLLLAILGVLVVDLGAVIFSRLQVQDIAESAAAAGAATYRNTGNANRALNDAELRVADKSRRAAITGFNVLGDGSVQVTVRVPASTMFFHRFDLFRDITVATGSAVAHPPIV